MIQPSETWREWNLPSDSSARFLFDPRYRQIFTKERRKDLFSRVRKFAQEYIQMPRHESYKLDGPNGEEFIFTLLGKGDGGQGYVYSLDEDFCLKIAAIGKNVSKYQESQFSINYTIFSSKHQYFWEKI
ncbi:hypothetical protein IPJ91_00015 [bacterium]|nr:MAG: hypothetical protein IPJ91_00015 [bacterium]